MVRRGSYAKGVAKREEILRVALEIIGREGLKRTTIRRIAQEVGITEAGVLHYFGTKENLYTQTLRARDDASETRERVTQHEPVDAFISIVDADQQIPGLVHLFAQAAVDAADPEHPAHEFFVDRAERIHRLLDPAVAEMQAAGQISDLLPAREVVRMLHALADGLQLQWMLDPEAVDMAEDMRAFMRLLAAAAPAPAPA